MRRRKKQPVFLYDKGVIENDLNYTFAWLVLLNLKTIGFCGP